MKSSNRPVVKRRLLHYDRWGTGQWVQGEEHAGIIHTKGHGALAIREGGTIMRVHGRPFWPVKPDEAIRARGREMIVQRREGETLPLFMEDGPEHDYQHPKRLLTTADIDQLETDTIEMAMADNQQFGKPSDIITGKLMIALLISVVVMGLVWLPTMAIGLMR